MTFVQSLGSTFADFKQDIVVFFLSVWLRLRQILANSCIPGYDASSNYNITQHFLVYFNS